MDQPVAQVVVFYSLWDLKDLGDFRELGYLTSQ